jgi:hypothetical protein
MRTSKPKSGIGLAQVIAELRRELSEAIAEGEGQALRFELGEIELDLAVELTESASAGLGFAVLVKGELGDSQSESRAQRVKVTLRPVAEAGGSIRASG